MKTKTASTKTTEGKIKRYEINKRNPVKVEF